MSILSTQTLVLLLPGALAAMTAASRPAPAIPAAPPVTDFTFIQCSDTHVPDGIRIRTGPKSGPPDGPKYGTSEVIAQIKTLTGPIELTPYHVTVPAPSFAIVTGDMMEFGGLHGRWEEYINLWKNCPFPVYHITGNHDNTWTSQRFRIRALHGRAYYSFNSHGCHFIGLDSATPQDPRPSFGEEEIEWLRSDLQDVAPETPLFIYFHHPLESTEFASLYERDRLLDLLRPYNLALLMVGHGHVAEHRMVTNIDQVMGGSTFGAAPGYSIISVKDGILRVAYRKVWDSGPTVPLLEKPLALHPHYPVITISQPADGATLPTGIVHLRASIEEPGITAAAWQVDQEKSLKGELQQDGGAWTADLDTQAWDPGCHTLRVTFKAGPASFQRTSRFYLDGCGARVLWRSFMGGSGKASPVVDGDLVAAGAGDGGLYAFDRATGKPAWIFHTGGEILAQPLAALGSFFVGSGDGKFYCVDRSGHKRWSFAVGEPVYSSAVLAAGKVVFAANNGHVYALDPATGRRVWENSDPGYSIESKPFVKDGVYYCGAWDGFLYAINLTDGSLRWKVEGAGSMASPNIARYYSPANAGPVVVGGKVWIADRADKVTVVDIASGKITDTRSGYSSTGLSADGSAIYLRGVKGQLEKIAPDGTQQWSVPAHTGYVPSVPTESGGVVYTASGGGLTVALDAGTGRELWRYQATPGLYVFSDPVASGGVAYITGMDGSVTALRAR